MVDTDRCPNCNVERSARAPEGLCPHCLMREALQCDSAVRFVDPAGSWTFNHLGPAQIVEGDGSTHDLRGGAALRYFGDYEIQKELGRGGMGIVFKARQVKLNRLVALKIIKAGLLADDDDLRRFQNEVEAIALLDHPGIVPVHEVGERAGLMYFSMKLIEGGNLAEQLASFKDNPRAAATLMAEAAEAVHHAHIRGILHRDLKPANILIDAEGHPHLTDFGVAKRVEVDFEMTQTGAILGTPAFMSPEQAAGRRGTITTATDVYGLGAIFYSMLTGKAPFGGDSVIETLDAVRSQRPELPRRLDARIPRDLETIALKCLEKDPRRRYPSAQAMAADLHCWLDSRPISARRVGMAERAWLWCQRRPAMATLLAAALSAFFLGTITIIALQLKANADLRSANLRVKHRFDLSMEAIRLFHGQAYDKVLQADQFKPLRDKLLRDASDLYEKLEGLPKGQHDRESRIALGSAYYELGDLTSKIGDKTVALLAHRKGLAVRRELASGPASDTELRVDMANSLRAVAELLSLTGKLDEALTCYEEVRDVLEGLPQSEPGSDERRALLGRTYNGIGFVLQAEGKTAAALSAYRRSAEIRIRLANDRPAVAEFQNRSALSQFGLGDMLSHIGKLDEALEWYRSALTILQKLADDNPAVTDFQYYLASNHLAIGNLLGQTDKPAAAMESFQRAQAIFQKLADDNPAVTDYQSRLAACHSSIGGLLAETGKPAAALESHWRALAIRQKLADDNPAVTDFQNRLAASQSNIGILLEDTGKPAEALEAHRRALAIRRKLTDDHPAMIEFPIDLADSLNSIGLLLSRAGKTSEALESYQRALSLQQRLADHNPDDKLFRSRLARSHTSIAVLLDQMDKLGEAPAIRRKPAEDNPAATSFQNRLTKGQLGIGAQLLELDEPPEALNEHERSQATYQWPALSNPTILGYRTGPASWETKAADVFRTLGQGDEVRDGYQRAIAICEALVKTNPNVTMYRSQLAFSVRRLGLVRLAAGDAIGAVADARRAAELYEGLPCRSGEERYELACCHSTLAAAAGREGSGISEGDAVAEADKAMDLLRRAVAEGYRNAALMAKDGALDPLRNRPDFRELMLDLAMPTEPFAPKSVPSPS